MISHLKVEKVLLSDLKFDGKNARKHDKKNLKAIKDSLDKFTQVEPLVVQKSTMKVIGGNGRLAAMKELGWKDCDVSIIDIDDERAKALGIVLNRSAELAEWEEQTLKESLAELEADGWDLEGLGWSDDDLSKMSLNVEESELPNLNDDENGPEMQQITFTLHRTQLLIIKEAVEKAKIICGKSQINTNSNGNGIFYICESFLNG